MLSNLHTHTTFCDGKNTAEDIVIRAIEKGFSSLGFSGHMYTEFDLSYCMTDVDGYLTEINRLKDKYKNDIQIYLGIEEDAFAYCDREKVDYIIGSCHYFLIDGKYYPVDESGETLKYVSSLLDNDVEKMARAYYGTFCDYLKDRKPEIIGHFDLITKFDEQCKILLNNERYKAISREYLKEALKIGSIFEINTGAISRGYRTTPYPSEELLYEIKKSDGMVTISSDSHSIDTLDFQFDEMKKMLKDIGFDYVYVMDSGKFIKEFI